MDILSGLPTAIATTLGIKYRGLQIFPQKSLHIYQDDVCGGSFSVFEDELSADKVLEKLTEMRKNFKG